MKLKTLILTGMMTALAACSSSTKIDLSEGDRYDYDGLLDISLTPQEYKMRRVGCFTDAGSWMGFTLPERDKWINGFCGPFSIDNRIWFAQSAVETSLNGIDVMTPDSISYFPGEIYMSSVSGDRQVCQRLVFVNSSTALINIKNNGEEALCFSGKGWNKDVKITVEGNSVIARHPEGEIVIVTFRPDIKVFQEKNNYTAITEKGCNETYVAVSFFTRRKKELLICSP